MQKIFKRPKTAGRIEMKEGKGFIYVIYRFYEDKVENQLSDLEDIWAVIDLDFSLEAIVKGKM